MSEAKSIDSSYFPLPALPPQHRNHNEWNISNLNNNHNIKFIIIIIYKNETKPNKKIT